MEGYTAEMVNSGFIEQLDTQGPTKLAQQSLTYIKDHLREASFTDQVITNKRVVRSDLQRSTEHDTLVKIVDIEPGSRAMALTFRGLATATYVTGKRYAIGFFTISSLKFEIVEQELMAYEMPVTKILEENSLKDMVELKDREFLIHVEACINAMQEEGNAGAVAYNATNINAGTVIGVSKVKGIGALNAAQDDFVTRAVQRDDLVDIKKLLKRQILDSSGVIVRVGRLKPALLLMTESDADDFDKFTVEVMGSKIQSETMVDGYGYNKSVGIRTIRTIKNDILREGNIYVFTGEEFFGRNYTLNDVKFYIDKIVNRIHWQAWMDIGIGIGNIAAVVKLELYGGSVIDGATDANYENAIPSDAENLGKQNNRVGTLPTFPSIQIF